MFVTRNSNEFLVTYSQNNSVSIVTKLRAGRMDHDSRQVEGSICLQGVHTGCHVHQPPIKQLSGHFLTYLITPCSRVLLEKLTGFAANQEIPRILWNSTHKRPPPVRSLSLGLKRPRREADHFHQSSASSNLMCFFSRQC
jgi:hypothetical protein